MKGQPSAPDYAVSKQDKTSTINTTKQRQFSHTKPTIIGAYNVRTLRETEKRGNQETPTFKQSDRFHQLIHGCEEKGIDLVTIQEHRLPADDGINTYIEIYNNKEWRFDFPPQL